MEKFQIFLQLLPQQLINGITLGATYALIALGYTMVYGIIQLINFAHGEIYMIGAFTGLLMVVYFKVNFFLAIICAILICVPLAMLIERVAYRPLRGSTRLATLISALGVSLFLQTLMTLIMGPNAQGFPEIVKDTIYTVGSVKFSLVQIVILLISGIFMVALNLTVKYTKVGKAMRATSESYETANLMGININRIISFTFAIGAALAGAGGGSRWDVLQFYTPYDGSYRWLEVLLCCCPRRDRQHSRSYARWTIFGCGRSNGSSAGIWHLS